MIGGVLPRPRGRPSRTVDRALRAYRRLIDPRSGVERRRRSAAVVLLYLEAMDRDDLAHYYAAVQQLLKEK
jgi:hypothetical protein